VEELKCLTAQNGASSLFEIGCFQNVSGCFAVGHRQLSPSALTFEPPKHENISTIRNG